MKTIFDFRAFLNFLGRNKLYTAINIFGFSISLMFVILLVTYTRQESAVDQFHSKSGYSGCATKRTPVSPR